MKLAKKEIELPRVSDKELAAHLREAWKNNRA
jgi:hypothetical protein